MGVKEDIALAQLKIKENSLDSTLYSDQSFIYKCTNENMRDKQYRELLRDNLKTLSVIGSGDQILNSILLDSFHIDAFDISRFPKYYLELKLAAVKVFSYEEYLEFFYGKNPFDKKQYKRLIDALEGNSKEFWRNIATTKIFSEGSSPREVYESSLFSKEKVPPRRAIELNPYLSKDNYNELKRKIDSASIHYLTGNILKIGRRLEEEYDFINLSNIIMYQPEVFVDTPYENPDCRFKSFIKNLKLSTDGRVLNYVMGYIPGSITYRLVEKRFRFDPDYRIHIIDNSFMHFINDGIVVYHKSK